MLFSLGFKILILGRMLKKEKTIEQSLTYSEILIKFIWEGCSVVQYDCMNCFITWFPSCI